MDILRQDLRVSLRSLRRSPGFAAAAVLVTALGIGATTAAFTLTDHILFRPFPFPDADRIVKIWEASSTRPGRTPGLLGTNDVAPGNYRDWRSLSTSFASMGAYTPVSSNLVDSGEPERLPGVSVTPDVLRAIGVAPRSGRFFDDADDAPGAACVVIISDGLRRARLPQSEDALGKKFLLDDEPCSIVGVMPPGFLFPARDTAFWRPMRLDGASAAERNNNYLRVVARLKPGVSREQAATDLARISEQLQQKYPDENRGVGTAVIALRDEVGSQSRTMIYAVAGASACLLLIACTNLASLFLARATSRSREFAVRTALGAGADRLVRQLMTDTVIIAIAGAALGVAIAKAVVPLAARLVPTTLPLNDVPSADWRMLLIAVAGTIVTVMTCGLAPALRAARQAAAPALRDGSRAGTSRRVERVRGVLVVAQVAASVALLLCTGLLLRALWRVQAIDLGYDTTNVVTMRLNLPLSQYSTNSARTVFHRQVLEGIEALPNVQAAGLISFLPLTQRGGAWGVYRPGQDQIPGQQVQTAHVRFVTPGYFDAMGIPFITGRRFDERDGIDREQVAIVSRTFGDKMWPGQSPIGRKFAAVRRVEATIVGVVGEVKARGVERANEPQMYFPATQHPDGAFGNYVARDLAVRTKRALRGEEFGTLAGSIRSIVAKVDPRLPVSDVRPLSEIVENDIGARSVQAQVLRGFAVVAVVLAGVGLHGLLAFMVSARTREIGVRLALGAPRGDILSMVFARALRLAAVGGFIGIGVGYFAGMSFRAVLAGVEPTDAFAMIAAVVVALAMTCAGSFWPAWRAARTDPMTATRAE